MARNTETSFQQRRDALLADPEVRDWVKAQIPVLDGRDVVDVLNDLDLLARLYGAKLDEVGKL